MKLQALSRDTGLWPVRSARMGQRPMSQGKRAFTLLELVLVMVLIAIILSYAAPSLRGWSRGSKLRDATDQMLSATRYARTQAIAKSTVCRLEFDMANGRYAVSYQCGQNFAPDPDEDASGSLPPGYHITVQIAQPVQGNAIEFYPTGRTQPAIIRITADNGESREIQCASAAEDFEVVQTQ
jgi:prepilin-type N-terminal cleavage/methylation domain-containing protein